MLRNTFLHVPGIGVKTERRLWSSGVRSWDEYFEKCPLQRPKGHGSSMYGHLMLSEKALEEDDPHFFDRLLPSDQNWRFFQEFRGSVAYLDIETTGLDSYQSHITTIALYDGSNIYYYVYGENLDEFSEDILKYKVIVTYNGRCFDVPFIRRSLGIEMDHAHIDLRYALRSLGYKGGLKGCEKQLGLERGELDGIDGYFAVLLWNDFRKNKNPKALETLLAYNIEDTVNLENLMVITYNEKIYGTPFSESHRLPAPPRPAIPYRPDRETVERIKYDILT